LLYLLFVHINFRLIKKADHQVHQSIITQNNNNLTTSTPSLKGTRLLLYI
jgi:hypothetical protein